MEFGLIMNAIFAATVLYSSYKMIEAIRDLFVDGDRIIASALSAALFLFWSVVISYVAFNHVFPWLDSL